MGTKLAQAEKKELKSTRQFIEFHQQKLKTKVVEGMLTEKLEKELMLESLCNI
jgi:hypothetical protein